MEPATGTGTVKAAAARQRQQRQRQPPPRKSLQRQPAIDVDSNSHVHKSPPSHTHETHDQSRSDKHVHAHSHSRTHFQSQPSAFTPGKHAPSSKYCYVLFVGPADAGKSTTLNKIFGAREISPVERDVGTSEVLEFRCKNLRVIDTPGLGAINSLEWDARIIGTLKKFMDANEGLRESIPSVVVLVARFDDRQHATETSSFVRALKELRLLNKRLFSSEYCNLVVMLTHFMNERRTGREFPNERIQLIRELVRKHLDKSCHIILGENEAEDWALPKLAINAYPSFRLPTGDVYPDNLVSLLAEVMGRSEQADFVTDVFNDRTTVDVTLNSHMGLIKENSTRFRKSLSSVKWALGIS